MDRMSHPAAMRKRSRRRARTRTVPSLPRGHRWPVMNPRGNPLRMLDSRSETREATEARSIPSYTFTCFLGSLPHMSFYLLFLLFSFFSSFPLRLCSYSSFSLFSFSFLLSFFDQLDESLYYEYHGDDFFSPFTEGGRTRRTRRRWTVGSHSSGW